jgi:transcriptional regulator with XRE-family HTH domain
MRYILTVECNLEKERKRKRLTRPELARRAGISTSYLYRLERGLSKENGGALVVPLRLAKALGVPVERLWRLKRLSPRTWG